MTLSARWIAAALLCLALVLRLPGLDWGLPQGGRFWTYHPDEPQVFWVAEGVRSQGWGWVTQYLISQPTGYALFVMGAQRRFFDETPHALLGEARLRREIRFFRSVNLAGSILALAIVFGIGRALGDARTGLAALAFAAVSPVLVYFGSFMTVNEAALPLTLAGLWAWVRYDLAPSTTRAVLAALISALATGIKYTAAPLFLLGGGLILLQRRPRDLLAAPLALALLLALLPYAWITPEPALRAYRNFFLPSGIYFREIHVAPWVPTMKILRFAFPSITIVAAAWFLGAGAKTWLRPGRRVLAAWLIGYGAILLVFGVRFARHFLPWIPIAILLAVLGGERWLAQGRGKILAALLFLFFLGPSLAIADRFHATDTRDRAEEWILARTPPGARIGMSWYFWSPALRGAGRDVATEVYPWAIRRDTAPRYAAVILGGPEVPEWETGAPLTLGPYREAARFSPRTDSVRGVEDLEYVSPEIRILVPR